MKTTIWLTTIAAMTSLFVSAQSATNPTNPKQRFGVNGLTKTASAKPLPQTTTQFRWDENIGDWDMFPDTIYRTYNTAGNTITENTAYYDSLYSYTTNRSYVYNAGGKEIASYQVFWNVMTMTWDTASKSTTTYDNIGVGAEYIYYSKEMGTGDWKINYAYKNIPTYDANNKVTEEINQEWVDHLSAYRNSEKSVYTYNNANQISGLDGFTWDTITSEFVLSYRIKDVVWHSWLPNDLENSMITSYVMQQLEDTVFIDAERSITTYDSKDNITEEKGETWSGSEWEVDYWSKYTLTYSVNDELTQKISQQWNETEFVNDQKEVYSDFYTPTTVGLAKMNPQQAFSVYPNPVNGNGKLTIQFTKATIGASISIMDLTGKEIVNSKLESTQTTIELPALKSGFYWYQTIENNEITGTGKLMIH